ncbi:protein NONRESPONDING TO OXYLIPINS 2, mitochondrial-like [Elaeis guineensis]|uniref:protein NONRESPONDING TO OXYLIPINS 2, mitochondrial-like n=1 Tax=Elaeis guineensis var. tenera TaxID=51953 RepID=UPI003C6DADBE
MASTSVRSVNRVALSSLRSFAAKSKPAARSPPFSGGSTAVPPPARRFSSFSRSAIRFPFKVAGELGCCSGSLLPLHSAVAAARLTTRLSLTSRSCRALSQGILCRTYPGL